MIARSILVVDDEPVIREAARRMLVPEGHAVEVAAGGAAALALLARARFDIALLDLSLGQGTGLQVLERIQETGAGTEAIVITGSCTPENAIASFRRGAFDFLPKPFSFEELLGAIQRASRARELNAQERVKLAGPRISGRWRFGPHAWARLVPGGTAELGATGLFLHCVGSGGLFELPPLQARVSQGGPLGRVVGRDGLIHTIHAALGGTVVAVHDGSRGKCPGTYCADLADGRLLVLIAPDDAARETAGLEGG